MRGSVSVGKQSRSAGVNRIAYFIEVEPRDSAVAAVAVEIKADSTVGHDVGGIVDDAYARADSDELRIGGEAEHPACGLTGIDLNSGRQFV